MPARAGHLLSAGPFTPPGLGALQSNANLHHQLDTGRGGAADESGYALGTLAFGERRYVAERTRRVTG